MSALEPCYGVSKEDYSQVFEIVLEEYVDYRCLPTFRRLSTDKMEESVVVKVNMSETRFIDSSGIALLHCLRHWIRSPDVSVHLLNCRDDLRHMLPSSKLHSSITLL